MTEKKEGATGFVAWFSELDKESVGVAGGKGANLAEIYNLNIPVPSGFVVTTKAFNFFVEKNGLREEIHDLLKGIDYGDTAQLEEVTGRIREMMLKKEIPEEMEDEIFESYGNLDAGGINPESEDALDIMKKSSEDVFVAVRSSATAEDLADASFAGQQDSFLNVRGKEDLMLHIKKCFASLFTARATYYRNSKGFEHDKVSLAVVVQKMVNSEKSGVIFSKDPSYRNDNVIIEAVFGLGEGIVSGRITPDRYVVSRGLKVLENDVSDKKIALIRDEKRKEAEISLSEGKSRSQVLNRNEMNALTDFALRIEGHYGVPQDVEFAIDSGGIYVVQTRAITTIDKRIEGQDSEIEGEVILTGLAASPGVGSGRIKIVKDLSDLPKVREGDVLVTRMTNPDMVVTMQKSAAIVTDEGGMTAHAAIVSREMGIPAVVGTREATVKFMEGEVITVDGFNGKIYRGKAGETRKKEILPVEVETRTKLKVIVDLPSFAERASKTGLRDVGLTRIEGIIAESQKHPLHFLKEGKMDEYEKVVYEGVDKIAEHFRELWVRASDIRSDEFSNLEGSPKDFEANPMLGMHGIRFGLRHPEILRAELNALKEVSGKGKTIGLLLPQLISVDELRKVKEIVEEVDFGDVKLGVMIETPASVQIIDDLCREGIKFVSFGTNDLTQYTLAIDRGNEQVQEIYDEMHPAVLRQMERVIRVCKEHGVETSICGQAGSRKEMVKFLIGAGIDGISVNADVASEMAKYVSELERDAPE